MTDEEKAFFEKNFKAGEYSVMTIFVRNDEIKKFMDHMKKANLNLAVMPGVQAKADFADPNMKGTEQ